MTKEDYQKAAASLLSQPVDDATVGYETEEGRRVRYDKKTISWLSGIALLVVKSESIQC